MLRELLNWTSDAQISDDNRAQANGSTRAISDSSSKTQDRKYEIVIHSKRARNQSSAQTAIANGTLSTRLLVQMNYCCADRISQQSDKWQLRLSCETLGDTEDWYKEITDGVRIANNEKKTREKMEQRDGICQEISDLVVYCKAVKRMCVDTEGKLWLERRA